MKKLMIALGAAALACGVQAATFNWSTASKSWGVAESALKAGLEDGKTYGVGSVNADTMSNQISSYAATWAYTLTLDDGDTTDTLTGDLGSSSFASRKISLDLDSDLAVAGKDLTYSIVFTGTVKDINNKTWDVTSNEITGSWHVNDQGDILLSTAAASSWSTPQAPTPPQPQPTPEPTSGLLVLLGMAGLALRRKA